MLSRSLLAAAAGSKRYYPASLHTGLQIAALFIGAVSVFAQTPASPASAASYRNRLLGVYNAQSGEPVEGAQVTDVLNRTTAQTTKTGSVTLAFLPDGASLVRIQKIGFRPVTLAVEISPSDTVPLTVLFEPSAQTLPTVTTTDSALKHVAPGLSAFEERRKAGFGHFVTEGELRKYENRKLTDIVRTIPSLVIVCPKTGFRRGECYAVARRQPSRSALQGGECAVDVYLDGALSTDNDLEKLRTNQFGGVEYYSGGATIPPQYNRTGSSCGVMLLWTRDR
ncbi:MAG: carboxypeptidase regulatory-like domain-containing protein [bacterium]